MLFEFCLPISSELKEYYKVPDIPAILVIAKDGKYHHVDWSDVPTHSAIQVVTSAEKQQFISVIHMYLYIESDLKFWT